MELVFDLQFTYKNRWIVSLHGVSVLQQKKSDRPIKKSHLQEIAAPEAAGMDL